MSKPRLLLWSPLPPPSGGIASWTKRLLSSALAERYDIRVVNTNQSGTRSGIQMDKALGMVAATARWAKELATWRPDVVHVNTSGRWPGSIKEFTAVQMARLSGAKTVLHFRGRGPQFLFEKKSFRAGGRPLLRLPHQTLVLNRAALEFAHDNGMPSARQVTGFVLKRPKPPRAWPNERQPIKLIYVGWMIEAKGLVELLEAVSRVPRVQLTMAGRYIPDANGDTLEAALDRRLAEDPGLNERVTRLGEIPPEQVWSELEAGDLFVLPSWSEGFPNALLEAMMCGLPALVTPAGAMPEAVVDGETGVVVPMRDADALTAALQGFVERPQTLQEMGDAAYERVNALYERDAVASSLADLYDELIGRDTSPGAR